MKINYFVFSCLLLCSIYSANAQNFTFSSDANGNRTGRTFTLLKSTVTVTPDTVQIFKESEVANDQIGNVLITLFPNPTEGIVIVQIQNLEQNLSSQLRVYDYSGRLIISRTNLQDSNTIDLGEAESGTYLVKIIIGDNASDWKIIKE